MQKKKKKKKGIDGKKKVNKNILTEIWDIHKAKSILLFIPKFIPLFTRKKLFYNFAKLFICSCGLFGEGTAI